MIKSVILDCDGPIIKREQYFSQRFSKDFGVPWKKIMKFFRGEFLECEAGRADLKEELEKYLPAWGWQGSTEELMEYWFSGERQADPYMLDAVAKLRKNGLKVYVSTNNEIYRTRDLEAVIGTGNIDGMLSSAYLGRLKPQREFWSEAQSRIGNPPKEEVLVWDDEWDTVESARAFGYHAEFFEDFYGFAEKMKGYKVL